MIVVVAPEPAAWIAPAVAALETIDAVELWAPWTMAARWAALPGAAGRFATRRRLDGAHGQPGWAFVQAAARAWAGDRVDRRYRLGFVERAAVDAWAARRLARMPSPPRAVIACTGAAQRTFAQAAARGATTVLVGDLPWLRRLHEDLDRAAAALPERAFLRRFRAPRDAIVRQEMERTLASLVVVRGHHAAETCAGAGVDRDRIVALPDDDRSNADRNVAARTHAERNVADRTHADGDRPADRSAARAIVLAGLATARNGVDAALAALAHHPDLRLRVRAGDGTEPADLLARPGVEPMPADPLAGALAVIAPAWCESYAPELARAAARGIPVVATEAGAGFTPAILVPPGDGAALASALASLRAGAGTATARARPADLINALRARLPSTYPSAIASPHPSHAAAGAAT